MSQSHTDHIWGMDLPPDLKFYLLAFAKLAENAQDVNAAACRLRAAVGI